MQNSMSSTLFPTRPATAEGKLEGEEGIAEFFLYAGSGEIFLEQSVEIPPQSHEPE